MSSNNKPSLLEYAVKELKQENVRLKDELSTIEKNEIKKREELLNLQSAALEAAANGIVITDVEGKINWVNTAFTKLTGYTKEEVYNQNSKILRSGAQDVEFYNDLWNTIKDGKTWTGELVNRRKDGSFYNEEMTITPVKGDDDKVTNFIAIKHNITNRKKNERNLLINQSSVEQSALGILWINMDSEIIYSNETILKYLGYERSEILGLKVAELDPHWPTKEYYDEQIKNLKLNDSLSFESINKRKDGSEFPVEVVLKLISYECEEIIVAYIKDISTRIVLREIEQLLINTDNFDDLLKGIHSSIKKVIDTPNCYIALVDRKSDLISFPYFEDEHNYNPEPRKLRKGLTEHLINTGKSLILDNEAYSKLVKDNIIDQIGPAPLSWIGVPLYIKSKSSGALVFQSYVNNSKFVSNDLEWLDSIAKLVATVIEKKIIEKKLIQYQKSVENAALGILWIDTERNIKYVNKRTSKKLNYSSSELLSMKLDDIVAKNIEEEDWKNDLVELRKSKLLIQEVDRKTRDGSEFPVEITSKMLDLDGEEIIISYSQDLSARKEAEKKSQENEEKFKAITNSTKDAIITTDEKTNIILWNKAAEELFGYTEQEAIGKSTFDIIIPNRLRSQSEERFKNISSIGKDFKGTFDIIANKKDGSEFEVELSVSLTEIGNSWFNTGIWRDLSQKKALKNSTDEEKEKIIKSMQVELTHLKSNYNILNTIIDLVPQRIYVKDKKSKFIKVNKSHIELMGKENDNDILGKTDQDFFKSKNAKEFLEEENEIMSTGKPITNKEHSANLQNGLIGWASTSKFPLYNIDGKSIGTFGITTDLTEKKKNEDELKDSHYKFRKLIENATLGIIRLDENGELIMANPAMIKMLKYDSEAELLSKQNHHIYSSLHSRDKFLQILKREEKIVGFEDLLLMKDRSVVDVRKSAWAIKDKDNNVIYYEVIIEDITEQNQILKILHESEFKYRILIDKLSEAVFLKIEDKLELVNSKFLEIFKLSEEDVYKEDFDMKDYLTDESKTLVKERSELLRAGTEVPKVYEVSVVSKSGEERDIEISVSYLNFNGKTTTQGIVRDLTEVRKQETQIRHLQKMEAIGTLAAGIAHEINTPSQFVNDNLTFLKESFKEVKPILDLSSKLTKDKNEFNNLVEMIDNVDLGYLLDEIPSAIDQSLDGVKRIANIVGAMRDFAHTGPKDKVSAQLDKIISSSIILSKNAWKYIAEIETNFDDSVPNIVCQPNDLNQVIVNMIVNSSHALESKFENKTSLEGKIKISTLAKDDNVQITISDNGLGMPEKVVKRIFDPFYTTKDVGKGTGQGLAIAYDIIVNKHHGDIKVISEEGNGTSFIITLPINQKIDNE